MAIMQNGDTGWSQLAGHEWAATLLADAIRQQRFGHAYLLTGPDQVGKTSLARLVAQTLNCEATPEQRPCGACRACRLIAADRHPDVRLVKPEVNDRGALSIKIDQMRELQQALSLSAVEARHKVAIIERFDAASPGAANAFLKTLEEPPSGVVLVLTATEADTLLSTIVSRCRTVQLRPVLAGVIEELLRVHHEAPPERAAQLAHMAAGRPGWAVTALQDEQLVDDRQSQLQLLGQAIAGTRVGRFALAEQIARRPESVAPALQTWLSWWRDLAQVAISGSTDGELSHIDRREELEQCAQRWTQAEILRGLQRTNQAVRQVARNANTRLALEVMLLGYPYVR